MKIEFHGPKDVANRRKHGISLARAAAFDFETALVEPDDLEDYGEDRWEAIGFLDGALYVLVFTIRGENDEILRPISLRKATKAEELRYVEEN